MRADITLQLTHKEAFRVMRAMQRESAYHYGRYLNCTNPEAEGALNRSKICDQVVIKVAELRAKNI